MSENKDPTPAKVEEEVKATTTTEVPATTETPNSTTSTSASANDDDKPVDETATTNADEAAAEPGTTATANATTTGSMKVYVGNLSWSVTSNDLSAHMGTTGCKVVSANVLSSSSGRSRGCGIVQFASADDAGKAILTLNDTDLMGRDIFVREDREDKQHQQGSVSAAAGSAGGAKADAAAAAGGTGGSTSSTRLYVGNLAYSVRWQHLKDFFRQAGNVVYAEVMTEGNGRSKGCGIVEFETAEEAEEAKKLSDEELNGRAIFVREDREIAKSNTAGSGGVSVYIGNLSYETSWQDLKDHMRAAGNVDKADVITGGDGRSKGCGVVTYQKPQEAARAIRELQDSMLNGRPIFVREDREKSHQSGRPYSNSKNSGGGKGCQLFVSNLSFDTTWMELKEHFLAAGDVDHVDVLEYPNGRKKGTATVRFFNAEDAENAVATLNGVDLMGRDLAIKIDSKAR